jgi:FKBP-type peptidyl-prolyl cis-trans isomerase FkpA
MPFSKAKMPYFFLAVFSLLGQVLFAQKGQLLTTEHGYKLVLHQDISPQKANFDDDVRLHVYVHVGDTMMQSSRTFAPNGYVLNLPSETDFKSGQSFPVIVDAALRMAEGDSATAFMPLDSFLRSSLPRRLRKANSVRYELKMIAIRSGEYKRVARAAAAVTLARVQPALKNLAEQNKAGQLNLDTKPSGLKILVVEPGKGAPIVAHERIAVHYLAALDNGEMFNTSLNTGQTLDFETNTGHVIPGFDEGVQHLRHGSKAYLFVPASLGYGAEGSGPVPANSDLIFYIEIQ